jgi:hypothetical protein
MKKGMMRVLGFQFNNEMKWQEQVNLSIKKCQQMRPALRRLRAKLSDKEFSMVITSHYFSRLYYGSELWFECCSKKLKKRIESTHYFALRLFLRDYMCNISRKFIDVKTERASQCDYNQYKIAKMLISNCSKAAPFTLYHDILAHSMTERRSENCPKFYDSSRLKIGKESFANRLSIVAQKLKFDWNGIEISRDSLRVKLELFLLIPGGPLNQN